MIPYIQLSQHNGVFLASRVIKGRPLEQVQISSSSYDIL